MALKFWQMIGFIFTGIAGCLLHFLYDWSGHNPVAALFSAVNESTWEHMKLLFFPMFLFSLIEYNFTDEFFRNFWSSKLIGIITGLILIPVIYYTYTGVLGVNADWFNIIIFFIASATAYYIEYILMKNKFSFCRAPFIALLILCSIAIMFIIMTFVQPKIPLFQDATTGGYGR